MECNIYLNILMHQICLLSLMGWIVNKEWEKNFYSDVAMGLESWAQVEYANKLPTGLFIYS